MLAKRAFDAWRTLSSSAPVISGVQCRSSQQLQGQGQLGVFLSTLWRFPLVYLFMFIIRFALLVAFRPVFKLTRQDLSFREMAFACVAGLRGSVSLILAQVRVQKKGLWLGLTYDW